MHKTKFVILGAGPSGLSFAHSLLARNENSFIVLEREAEAGGLCRSKEVDGAPLDIGGGHFLDIRNKEALDLLFQFMPESEWNRHSRIAKIRLRGSEVDHPLEANLWQLPLELQTDYLESISQAGCVRGEPMPEAFEDWCRWKFGIRIAEDYMLPYNRKIWRIPLNQLGTYWLYKLPNVSFRETLMSCLQRQMHGALPAHGEFLYPKKFGYGEVWRRMGEALGERLHLNTPVTSIDPSKRIVNGEFQGQIIVNSIPWHTWESLGALPADIAAAARQLVNVSIDVDYHAVNHSGPAHWTYEPDETVNYHRILARSNFAPASRGYWTETNARFSPPTSGFRHRNEFAYPVNTIDKPRLVGLIHAWAASMGVFPLGRWGQWEHMNSDVAVAQGIKAAATINTH